MPLYVYKAVTANGLIVKNRVEDINKQSVVKRLKHNDLMPISVIQLRRKEAKPKKKKEKKYSEY